MRKAKEIAEQLDELIKRLKDSLAAQEEGVELSGAPLATLRDLHQELNTSMHGFFMELEYDAKSQSEAPVRFVDPHSVMEG